ncbi:MAG: ROK family protein [Bdellovibrio sp.]|nr:ROK family protein [Bdellovibrio sp.]
MTQKVLSFDLGGTKLAAGVVSNQGKVLCETRVPAEFSRGKEAVIRQIVGIGKTFLKRFEDINTVGVASAGPLDPIKGVLLDPTNFVSKKGRWGRVNFTDLLEKKLNRRILLENDAAAAILAEHWVGAARGYDNAMILTLGTGLGTGVICNGKLVRVGSYLHTEAGHMIIGHNDRSALCGCGNLGCAEAYLSGKLFAKRTSALLGSEKTADEITTLAKRKNPIALKAFDEYADWMAVALCNFYRIFNPEIFVFTGGFAAASPLFLPQTHRKLTQLLNSSPATKTRVKAPRLCVSALNNDAGLIGAAYHAVHSR